MGNVKDPTAIGRVYSCDCNDEDTVLDARDAVDSLPEGWAAVIIPDEGHPFAVFSHEVQGGDFLKLDFNSALAMVTAMRLHDMEDAQELLEGITKRSGLH